MPEISPRRLRQVVPLIESASGKTERERFSRAYDSSLFINRSEFVICFVLGLNESDRRVSPQGGVTISNWRRGVPKNVPAPFCVPLHCTAFDCDGEGARTP